MGIKLYDIDIKNFTAKESGITFSLVAFAYFVASIICSIVATASGGNGTAWFSVLTSFIIRICFLAVIIFVLKIKNYNIKRFYAVTEIKYLPIALVLMASMLLGLGGLNEYFTELLKLFGITVNSTVPVMDNGLYLGLTVVSTALLPAITEEILFRGMILQGTCGKNVYVKCAVCGLMFMLFHCNLSQTLYQFVFGFSFALLAVRSGTIIWGTLMHFINNAFILFTYYFAPDFVLTTPIVIIVGSLGFAASIIYLVFFDKNERLIVNENDAGKKFFIGASFGILLYVIATVLSAVGV